ncbi:50S ribosomal protein L22 [bacterium]|nr:MAG: 50S ribosomal protein L22 [bacterium]RKZ14067.1 MAG: 50S ribosomal protein L22 [bacterium]
MESRAISRYNRVSARKARLVADVVRGLPVEQAVHALELMPKKAAPIIQKTILAAVANARQKDEAMGMSEADFVISEIIVEEGPTQKRIRARAQGRAFRIRKRTSHIKVTVAAGVETDNAAAGE